MLKMGWEASCSHNKPTTNGIKKKVRFRISLIRCRTERNRKIPAKTTAAGMEGV